MKKLVVSSELRKAFHGRSRGFTLIEVLIALALFAIIAIVFAGGLGTASKAVAIADVRTNAESLARTQMESIKEQGYNSTYSKITSPAGYLICSCNSTSSVPLNCSNTDRIIAVSWDSANDQPAPGDTGLQKITLVIKHEGDDIITLEGYKVQR